MLGYRSFSERSDSLLARYSETLGELALRSQTELAIRVAKIQAEQASRAKSAFLATMSHELRTPLNAIIGFSDLIANLKPDRDAIEKGADYAIHIQNAGRHLLQVVSDILDVAKIESGTFSLNINPVPVADVIDASIMLIEERIRAKNQRIERRLSADLPCIPLDERRVKQILINLLSNANKFTPERGRILVSARRNADGGATISVVDTGVGMTPEQLKVAMAPFGQVQSHYARTQEGTGLGLPIASALAQQHGGNLHLESEPDVGTAAVLRLPGEQAETPGAPITVMAGGGERRKARK